MATKDLDSFAGPKITCDHTVMAGQLGVRAGLLFFQVQDDGSLKALTDGLRRRRRASLLSRADEPSATSLFLIVGLGAGAVYAGLAMALVTTYRGTGVINIAQGAMAMWSAFVFDELRTTGDLVLPVGRIHVARPVGAWPAFAVGVASAAVLALARCTCWCSARCAPRRPSAGWSPRSA